MSLEILSCLLASSNWSSSESCALRFQEQQQQRQIETTVAVVPKMVASCLSLTYSFFPNFLTLQAQTAAAADAALKGNHRSVVVVVVVGSVLTWNSLPYCC